MPEFLINNLPVAACVLFAISAMTVSQTCFHMLQLSSYQTPGYWKWLKRGAGDYYYRQWPLALIAILGLLNHWLSWVAVCALLLVLLFMNIPDGKKAKKPMVYTPRVMRLEFAQAVIIALCGVGIYFLAPYHRFALVWTASAYMAVPFITMLSNWITMPVQKLINQGFIRDAKKRLAGMPRLKVIGITGSYGKTSMKYILTSLLSVSYETLMTPESYNTTMGVVRTIREKLQPTHEIFVCEMGARHIGDIREICRIVKPQMGVLTSIGEQHLDTFGSLENVVKAKFELIEALSGTAFLNLDSGPVREHCRSNAVTYAITHSADYTLTDLKASETGSSFTIHAPDGTSQTFDTGLLGAHNALNILGAAAVAHNIGIPLDKLVMAVKMLPAIPHRLQLIKGNGFTVIDDAYNANPNGVRAALDTLSLFEGTKILITPGMVELGDRQDACNREMGLMAAKVCDHVILVGERQTASIAEGLAEAGFKSVKIVETVKEAMKKTNKLDGENKVILLSNDLPDNYGHPKA